MARLIFLLAALLALSVACTQVQDGGDQGTERPDVTSPAGTGDDGDDDGDDGGDDGGDDDASPSGGDDDGDDGDDASPSASGGDDDGDDG
jgi:hypothetical protein